MCASGSRCNPGGKLPLVTAKVYGALPPPPLRPLSKLLPTVGFERLFGLTLIVGHPLAFGHVNSSLLINIWSFVSLALAEMTRVLPAMIGPVGGSPPLKNAS